MKRTIVMLLSGIIVLLAIGGIFLYMQMDTMAKSAIEKYGSAIVGTKLTVAKVEISTASGEGIVDGLAISNPTGFELGHAFIMPTTQITVDRHSFTTDIVTVDEVVMDGPEIIYEVNNHGNNYAVLRKNINDYMATGESRVTEGVIASKEIIIKDFYLRNGKVKVIAPMLQNKSFEVSIPTIHLSNVGKGQGKGNLPQVMNQIMTVVTNTITSSVGNVTLDNFLKFLPNTASGVANGVLNETGTTFQNVGEGIGEVFGGKK